MWWYLIIGLVSSLFMCAVFRPIRGYRPPMHIWAASLLTFVALWPFVLLLFSIYAFSSVYQKRMNERDHGSPRDDRPFAAKWNIDICLRESGRVQSRRVFPPS